MCVTGIECGCNPSSWLSAGRYDEMLTNCSTILARRLSFSLFNEYMNIHAHQAKPIHPAHTPGWNPYESSIEELPDIPGLARRTKIDRIEFCYKLFVPTETLLDKANRYHDVSIQHTHTMMESVRIQHRRVTRYIYLAGNNKNKHR